MQSVLLNGVLDHVCQLFACVSGSMQDSRRLQSVVSAIIWVSLWVPDAGETQQALHCQRVSQKKTKADTYIFLKATVSETLVTKYIFMAPRRLSIVKKKKEKKRKEKCIIRLQEPVKRPSRKLTLLTKKHIVEVTREHNVHMKHYMTHLRVCVINKHVATLSGLTHLLWLGGAGLLPPSAIPGTAVLVGGPRTDSCGPLSHRYVNRGSRGLSASGR